VQVETWFSITEPSVAIGAVDGLFLALQSEYRGYEKELNQMKAEIKETVNNLTREAYDKHQKELDVWKEKHREYSALWTDLRAKFTTWRTNELERISNLKITIPSSLKDTFLMIKEIADTSK
jgi:hypothetical protein